jgi:hypothetical protein
MQTENKFKFFFTLKALVKPAVSYQKCLPNKKYINGYGKRKVRSGDDGLIE